MFFFSSQNSTNNASDGHRDWDTFIRYVFISSRYVCSNWVPKQLYTDQPSFIKVKMSVVIPHNGLFIHGTSSLSSNKPARHNVYKPEYYALFTLYF